MWESKWGFLLQTVHRKGEHLDANDVRFTSSFSQADQLFCVTFESCHRCFVSFFFFQCCEISYKYNQILLCTFNNTFNCTLNVK